MRLVDLELSIRPQCAVIRILAIGGWFVMLSTLGEGIACVSLPFAELRGSPGFARSPCLQDRTRVTAA
jgi:hypothetical protein